MALMKQKMQAPIPQVELRFVIGTHNLSSGQVRAINQEAASTGDILLVDAPDRDIGKPDKQSATTLKVLHSINYAVNNYKFDFFARVGDDAYFRVDYFVKLAMADVYPKDYSYIGYAFYDHPVPATSSTHNFIVGMGFLLTYDLAQYVCVASSYLHDGFPEDAVVGAWFVGTKARIIHDPNRFHDIDNDLAYAPCTNNSLLMHHMRSQALWDSIDEQGLLKC